MTDYLASRQTAGLGAESVALNAKLDTLARHFDLEWLQACNVNLIICSAPPAATHVDRTWLYSFGRMSRTRLALPSERSIAPGSATVTRTETPTTALT